MNFPILYVLFTNVTAAFSSSNGQSIRKIVFQFQFNDTNPVNEPTLIGYASKQQGSYDPNPDIELLKSSANSVTLNKPINLGNLEFTRTLYNNLGTPMTYLVFTPKKDTTYPNSVTYQLSWSSSQPLAETVATLSLGDLNPSPPKPPMP